MVSPPTFIPTDRVRGQLEVGHHGDSVAEGRNRTLTLEPSLPDVFSGDQDTVARRERELDHVGGLEYHLANRNRQDTVGEPHLLLCVHGVLPSTNNRRVTALVLRPKLWVGRDSRESHL